MPASIFAKASGPPFPTGLNTEAMLRASFFRLGGGSDGPREEAPDDAKLIRETAVFLELQLAVAIAHEVADSNQGSEGAPEACGDEELARRIEERSGLKLENLLRDTESILGLSGPKPPQRAWIPKKTLTRRIRSILEACPIGELERMAASLDLEGWGHRARTAYDGLHAFLFRTSEPSQEQLRIAGSAYEQGHLSLAEVAKLLSIHPVDAVVLLEQAGFDRTVEVIALSDGERTEILAAMRDDRLHRGGVFEPDPETISRDAVASERIEGIDARRWISREGP